MSADIERVTGWRWYCGGCQVGNDDVLDRVDADMFADEHNFQFHPDGAQ